MLLTWPDRGDIHVFLNGQTDLFLEHLLFEVAAVGAPYYRLSVHFLECLQEVMEQRRHPLLSTMGGAGSCAWRLATESERAYLGGSTTRERLH
jgi:hypothetical protein